MNTSLSYCDDGNSSSIDFLLEGGVGLTVQFLKLNQTVKMMPSISFVPGIIFQNSSQDTSKIFLAFVLCLFEKNPKGSIFIDLYIDCFIFTASKLFYSREPISFVDVSDIFLWFAVLV